MRRRPIEEITATIQNEQGWTDNTLLQVVTDFIDVHADRGAFERYLRERAAEENSLSDDDVHSYTLDGVWDDGGNLVVQFIGVDMTEDAIQGVVAGNRNNDAFTHTVTAGSEKEAFRELADELDAHRVYDGRRSNGSRSVLYDVERLQ